MSYLTQVFDRGRKRGRIVLGLMLVFFSVAAFALDLHTAKSQGLVGETATGYLGVVAESSQVAQLVRDINAQRKAEYQRIASKNNISLADVEALAGKKAIEKTPPGQYVNVGSGWIKK